MFRRAKAVEARLRGIRRIKRKNLDVTRKLPKDKELWYPQDPKGAKSKKVAIHIVDSLKSNLMISISKILI